MKIKEIKIEVRLSHKYNSYACAETITIEENDKISEIKDEAWRRCHAECEKQIGEIV